ncbi:hypothetical protein K493DRAFT_54637 [Basidiobolus meristosporus CBS 931.73]|uniref:Chromatin assembly factor 1 subunit A dimerization domain-containing protein n=1 Tax=Basidiobolus meristosporus CBS 931.73 TaxID=1314790 RepID=A0A1Y1Z289_9FUNG|nr:hypothetical protein K493DRAFT_54637 [Basidiobolus meristosporus CBS 931.73]|eukprot:ORY04411.1 hypothetical protein K493DRAFT_54637 [Basidiobolus meristosporus CBS 931.73]
MPSKSAPSTPKKSGRSLLSFFTPSPCASEGPKIPEKESPFLPETTESSCSVATASASNDQGLVDRSENCLGVKAQETEYNDSEETSDKKELKIVPYVYIEKCVPKGWEVEEGMDIPKPQNLATSEVGQAPAEVDSYLTKSDNVENKSTSDKPVSLLEATPNEGVIQQEQPVIPARRLVELKNERLVFHEKKITFLLHPDTIVELASFHVSMEGNAGPLLPFPQEFHPLLCKLIQESDLPLSSLVSHVMDILCPTGYKDDDAPVELPKINPRSVENSILLLARHHNYIDSNAILDINHEDERPCSNLAIVRWEVQNLESAFSPDLIKIIERRREKRKQASSEVQALFDSLPDDQKEKIRTIAQASKRKRKVQDVIDEELKRKEREEREAKKRKAKEQKEAEKRHLKEQKEFEKKLQKEEERKKKEEAQKQKEQGQTRLQGFFSSIKKDRATTAQPESYFDELFRPFHVKQCTFLAPINRFAREPSDNYEVALHSEHPAADFKVEDLFHENLQGWKSAAKYTSCRSQRNDATWIGDEDSSILVKSKAPKMKLLQFAENYRPAYYGTWSKKSHAISGRKCFARDTGVFDYDYDSEAEWEEDEEGEECKSDDDDSEEDPMDAEEDQEDGWLVPTGYLSEDEMDEDSISGKSSFESFISSELTDFQQGLKTSEIKTRESSGR